MLAVQTYACHALLQTSRRSKRLGQFITPLLDGVLKFFLGFGQQLRDHVQPGGELGYFQTRFNVYDRAGIACPTRGCSRTVRRLVQAGRSTFYCAHCQR